MDLYLDEEYKIIKDFPDYAITNYGRVYSFKANKFLKLRTNRGKTNKLDYYHAALQDKNKYKDYPIHRLVALYFIPYTGLNPDGTIIKGNPQINHKDSNTANNKVNNLEWCDSAYNNKIKLSNKWCNFSIDELIEERKKYKPKTPVYFSITSIIHQRRKHEVC